MIEFLKQQRIKCAQDAKVLNFWYSSRNEDLMG
ncbi:hypothetical protein NVP1135O_40 [Vibrio phage 1.135.O._10N.222.54.B6]|nr:hypothetical protein NVP1135O_40 [Vibrio phage 1.135.O._10N.222.54.B6]